MKRLSPHIKAALPPASHGWFAREYTVLLDGSLARLEANFDIGGAMQLRHEQAMARQQPNGPWPPYPDGTRERIVTFGPKPSISAEFLVDEIFAKFDRLSNGDWIVADCRCAVVESNARIIDENGNTVSHLLVGDGIEDLQCDADNKIWVGYFDEGIFGNNGWGLDGPPPIGQTGINCFNSSGAIVWPDCRELGQSEYPLPFIAGSHGLNVTSNAVWICPYTDFPIVRIGEDRSVRIWSNNKQGADILAVDSDTAVLLGGYDEERCHGILLDLLGETARRVGEFEIDVGVDDLRTLPLASARGETLNFVANDGWYQLTVQDVVRELV